MPVNLERKTLRQTLIARREALSADERNALEERIGAHLCTLLDRLPAQIIGFCWPYRGEADILPALCAWQAEKAGRILALPVVPQAPGPLSFHYWKQGVPMQADQFGIPAPVAQAQVVPDLLIVPVNGFDARGYRIGYGGGYFDRTLAAWQPPPLTVGVGFELARLESVEPQAHDRPLDWIVTEAGYWMRTKV